MRGRRQHTKTAGQPDFRRLRPKNAEEQYGYGGLLLKHDRNKIRIRFILKNH